MSINQSIHMCFFVESTKEEFKLNSSFIQNNRGINN